MIRNIFIFSQFIGTVVIIYMRKNLETSVRERINLESRIRYFRQDALSRRLCYYFILTKVILSLQPRMLSCEQNIRYFKSGSLAEVEILTHCTLSIFSVWDYNTNSKLTHWNPDRGIWNRNISRITALDLVNAHDHTMLLVGSEDGAVRLWSNYTNNVPNKEPTLVTAWQSLSELSTMNRTASGLRMAWDQRSQSLLAGGDARIVRVWDADSELKVTDISTGTDAWVNSLSVDSDG